MTDRPRLIEVAFPLKQASLDSVHEKNVRPGHISTLHIWPARRPLAASRAALIATLLPDPGNAEERQKLLERIGGTVVHRTERKKVNGRMVEVVREATDGGILHWGRESDPDIKWFREEIRKAYGGRAPKVLDPFAGGGAIPLEAMRLGCEATAVDINPVAWFLLKCTLEYPQKLAGKQLPLPKFAFESSEFMAEYVEATAKAKKKGGRAKRAPIQTQMFAAPEVDLSWHVRAWGHWVLQQARATLEPYYPVVDGRTAVAYLWARTIECKNCRKTIPLLKSKWLSKKDSERAVLAFAPTADHTISLIVQSHAPIVGANAAQKREHDRTIGKGTVSRSGVQCPSCGIVMASEDIRLEAQAGRLGVMPTAVVTDDGKRKAFRSPHPVEIQAAQAAQAALKTVFSQLPFEEPCEPVPQGSSRKGGGSAFTVHLYGLTAWKDLFLPRQLLALGTFLLKTREAAAAIRTSGYPEVWAEALVAYLGIAIDRTANYLSTLCIWDPAAREVKQTFLRFALPITWDFSEANPLSAVDRYYVGALSSIASVLERTLPSLSPFAMPPTVIRGSAIQCTGSYDIVVTDPPYYDAIPYSDLMDFFYVWLKRIGDEVSAATRFNFGELLCPKWDTQANDGELIDEASRFGGDSTQSRLNYEDGMARAFTAMRQSLASSGRLVIVFAHKQPAAWETLVAAIIRSGFVVDGSWPIATEMRGGVRNLGRSSLASSVWLVCRKRPDSARPGWDNRVLEDMRERIYSRLRDFWDAGIRGPDFVWAATGPALEAYSRHPVVKKANEPGQAMTVSEFLRHVRRIVVDFVVGRVLTRDAGSDVVASLDDVTTYYLLHRHDFGYEDASAGACILYAVSCGLSDRELTDHHDLLARKGKVHEPEENGDDEGTEEDGEGADEADERSGSKVRLKPWDQRRRKGMGFDSEGHPAPLIDQVHRLMHLWRAGDLVKVDEFLDARVLRKNRLFHQLLQALIELSSVGSEERSLLESISNHVAARGLPAEKRQLQLEV